MLSLIKNDNRNTLIKASGPDGGPEVARGGESRGESEGDGKLGRQMSVLCFAAGDTRKCRVIVGSLGEPEIASYHVRGVESKLAIPIIRWNNMCFWSCVIFRRKRGRDVSTFD